jgi:CheY-like chemotaxis protein
VDDHEMNRDLARTVLQKAGHFVDVAQDGAVAVHKARERAFDIILMDIQMPGMDGLEATRQIRAIGSHYGSLPIVAMTANVLADQVVQYLAAGMTDHIAKPLDTKQLLRALGRWMQPSASSWQEHVLEPEGSPSEHAVHDFSAWNDLLDLLGAERVQRFAASLHSSLTADCWAYDGSVGTEPLRAAAHACVALAGQLGFGALSVASRELETACRNERGVEAALDAFGLARLRALIELEQLLASLSHHSGSRAFTLKSG